MIQIRSEQHCIELEQKAHCLRSSVKRLRHEQRVLTMTPERTAEYEQLIARIMRESDAIDAETFYFRHTETRRLAALDEAAA